MRCNGQKLHLRNASGPLCRPGHPIAAKVQAGLRKHTGYMLAECSRISPDLFWGHRSRTCHHDNQPNLHGRGNQPSTGGQRQQNLVWNRIKLLGAKRSDQTGPAKHSHRLPED
uniref:(northern house mosquito) hypothetical protein n=1 Tax=Culex pipiens TaxID=7175 RepID=A0A8D8FE12_CULPI